MATSTKSLASKISGRSVTLVANRGSKITPDVVHAAFEKIFRLNGCLACGLIGIDIHVHGGDPDPLIDVEGFTGNVR
jgi:hypothetical protein